MTFVKKIKKMAEALKSQFGGEDKDKMDEKEHKPEKMNKIDKDSRKKMAIMFIKKKMS